MLQAILGHKEAVKHWGCWSPSSECSDQLLWTSNKLENNNLHVLPDANKLSSDFWSAPRTLNRRLFSFSTLFSFSFFFPQRRRWWKEGRRVVGESSLVVRFILHVYVFALHPSFGEWDLAGYLPLIIMKSLLPARSHFPFLSEDAHSHLNKFLEEEEIPGEPKWVVKLLSFTQAVNGGHSGYCHMYSPLCIHHWPWWDAEYQVEGSFFPVPVQSTYPALTGRAAQLSISAPSHLVFFCWLSSLEGRMNAVFW